MKKVGWSWWWPDLVRSMAEHKKGMADWGERKKRREREGREKKRRKRKKEERREREKKNFEFVQVFKTQIYTLFGFSD